MIPLSQGMSAMVDDGDFDSLSKFKWSFSDGYAVRVERGRRGGKQIKMHRQITNASIGVLVDHRDTNGLNNQRYNLRLATQAQNAAYKTAAHDKAIKERESLANIITEIEKASGELQKAAKEQAAKDRDSLNAVVSRLGKAAKEVHIHPFGKRTVNFDKTAGEAIDGYLADQAK